MSEKLWLIKAGGRILGPMTQESLNKSIVQREFLALDEVSGTFGRWRYLRDCPEFEKAIVQARGHSQSVDELTSTNTQTSTETITEVIGSFASHDSLKEGIQDQIRRPTVEVVEDSSPPANIGYYEISNPKNGSRSATPRWAWTLLVVVAVGVSWSLFNRNGASTETKEMGTDEYRNLLQAGLTAREVGDNSTAIRLLQKAEKMNPENLEVVLNLTPLLVMEHETVLARRILEKHISREKGPSFQKRAQNILALAALGSFDLAKAEAHLDESLNSDALYLPAIVNRGVVHSLRKEFEKAKQKFNQ
ncbi:MAG: hypothetical protein KDD25_08710, partial [Bdellovibrionales bacterium]|nr:hypothetical protein [Bdellovibrionales bacterium]